MNNQNTAARTISYIASGMIDGSINYLVGAYQLAALRHEVDAYANDPDFMPFIAILSEIDSLNLGITPDRWTDDFISRHKGAIEESTEWAKSISLQQCISLSERYK